LTDPQRVRHLEILDHGEEVPRSVGDRDRAADAGDPVAEVLQRIDAQGTAEWTPGERDLVVPGVEPVRRGARAAGDTAAGAVHVDPQGPRPGRPLWPCRSLRPGIPLGPGIAPRSLRPRLTPRDRRPARP